MYLSIVLVLVCPFISDCVVVWFGPLCLLQAGTAVDEDNCLHRFYCCTGGYSTSVGGRGCVGTSAAEKLELGKKKRWKKVRNVFLNFIRESG